MEGYSKPHQNNKETKQKSLIVNIIDATFSRKARKGAKTLFYMISRKARKGAKALYYIF
jgi:hypothetical protein